MAMGTPFTWGSKGRKMTPEAIERERALLEKIQGRAGDTSPVGHWLQGAGRVVDAITGKVRERRADASEKMGMDSADEYVRSDPVLSGLIGGKTGYTGAPVEIGPEQGLADDVMGAIGKPATGADPDALRSGLVERGLPEHVAEAFVMNFQDESGLNPGINEAAPIVPGSRGGFGLAQWTGPRRKALEAFATKRGVDVSDTDMQLDFLMTELQGPESGAAKSILAAQDSGQAAAAIVNKFLRPAEEHRASREARYTGGKGYAGGGVPQQQPGVVGALAQAMSDPWVAKKYGPVIQALMGQEMKRGDMQYQQQLAQSDPAYQMGLEKSQMELDQMRNPAVDPWAGTQVINGQVVQMGDNGPEAIGDFNTPEPGYTMLTPEEAAAQGLPPGAYQRGPDNKISAVGGGGVTVNNDMGGNKFEEAFAKGDAATIEAVSNSGLAAQRNLGRIDQLEALLSASPTGVQGVLKQAAGEWGINTEGLTEIQAAQALINSLVPEQRQPGSGPMSDADLELFKQSLPRIINQPGGNEMILGTMRAIAQYDAEGAQIAQELRAGALDRAEAFDRLQRRVNPLQEFKQPAQVAQPAPSPSQGEVVPQGVDPEDWKFMTPEQKAIFQ